MTFNEAMQAAIKGENIRRASWVPFTRRVMMEPTTECFLENHSFGDVSLFSFKKNDFLATDWEIAE